MSDKDLVESNEEKDIVVFGEKADHLDEHGRIIHEDKINFKVIHKDLIFMHETLRMVADKDLVPPDEVGPFVTLLEMMAEQEADVHRYECLLLPVNYFLGLWHGLNTARKFSLYLPQWVKKDKHLDWITTNVAKYLDKYHMVKSHEANEEKIKEKPYFAKIGNKELEDKSSSI